jgi:hypothetical protein
MPCLRTAAAAAGGLRTTTLHSVAWAAGGARGLCMRMCVLTVSRSCVCSEFAVDHGGGAGKEGPERMLGGAKRIVSLFAQWQQQATPQPSAHTPDVMADVLLQVKHMTRHAFERSGCFMGSFVHNPQLAAAYERFMAAACPPGGALPRVSLAFHGTPGENVKSIFRQGLKMSCTGT